MPVSIDKFSDIAARQDIRDRGVVTVDARQNVTLGQSRFRLVRWIRHTGIGRRAQNRRTVGEFIDSLQHHYGREVTSRMDLRRLRDMQTRGKPLHARHVRAVIGEADMVADGVKMVKSSNIEALIDANVAGFGYVALPDGQELAAEVRNRVDVAETQRRFAEEQHLSFEMHDPSGDSRLDSARAWASEGVRDAHKDVFLTGYGVKTAQGVEHGKLQAIADAHPLSQDLQKYYGLRFDASRASGALRRALSEELTRALSEALENPADLPGDGTVKARIEQAIGRKADEVFEAFLTERVQAVETLHEMSVRGEVPSEDLASYHDGRALSLADVVLHHRIPPGALSRLHAARDRVPDNVSDLAAADHTREHKLQVLRRFGEAIAGIEPGLSKTESDSYLPDEEHERIYIEDCGRFLLEGKISTDDHYNVRHTASTDPSRSELLELCDGIARMKGAAGASGANDAHWEPARSALENMTMAGVALLGPDAARLGGAYTVDAANVLNDLRNCGIEAPPPDNVHSEQSGRGAFSQWALQAAQEQMLEDLGDVRKAPSTEYPEFMDESIRDFGRANYVIGGTPIRYGDTAGVVEGIGNFCTDGDGNVDERMVDRVGKLVYQRSNAMAYNRFSSGMDVNDDDKLALLRTAPFAGVPSARFSSTYSVDRTDSGNVALRISSTGPANYLSHSEGLVALDENQSAVSFDIDVEVDGRDYSARVTDMRYEFRLVPAGATQ